MILITSCIVNASLFSPLSSMCIVIKKNMCGWCKIRIMGYKTPVVWTALSYPLRVCAKEVTNERTWDRHEKNRRQEIVIKSLRRADAEAAKVILNNFANFIAKIFINVEQLHSSKQQQKHTCTTRCYQQHTCQVWNWSDQPCSQYAKESRYRVLSFVGHICWKINNSQCQNFLFPLLSLFSPQSPGIPGQKAYCLVGKLVILPNNIALLLKVNLFYCIRTNEFQALFCFWKCLSAKPETQLEDVCNVLTVNNP